MIVIGNPSGADHNSISCGVVREINFTRPYTPPSIMGDVATSGGNSGGPILNNNGKVTGLLTFTSTLVEEFNGGPRGSFIKSHIDTMIDTFVSDETYNVRYGKSYSGVIAYQIATADVFYYEMTEYFVTEGNDFEGLYCTSTYSSFSNSELEDKLLTKVEYTDKSDVAQTIIFKSDFNHSNDTICTMLYDVKPSSVITYTYLNPIDGEDHTPTTLSYAVTSMPDNIDIPLTNGTSGKFGKKSEIKLLKCSMKMKKN
jgi:hypothetical protein